MRRFILAIASLTATPIFATDITLDFSSLPSSQGWVWQTGGPFVFESSVFSVSGGILSMDSPGREYYSYTSYLDPNLPFTLTTRARVISGTTDTWLDFYVANPTGFANFFIGRDRINSQFVSGSVATGLDNTQFHDIRLTGGTNPVSADLFYDNVLIGTIPFGCNCALGGQILGDTSGTGMAEVTSYSLVQSETPEPGTGLISLVSLALAVLTAGGRQMAQN
jgi:hypothetical protein